VPIWYKGGSDLESNDGAGNTFPGSFVNSGTLDLSSFGNILQVRFNFISGWGPDCFIDNIYVGGASNCPPPSNLVANNVTQNSAEISWNPGGSETACNFEYGPSGFIQGNGTSFVANIGPTTIANQSSLFTTGNNATWSHIYPIVLISDGAASQAAQTFTINVTSLPAGGAKMRLIKSLANSSNSFLQPSAAGVALQLGLNTITAGSVAFDRYVKIQFNNDAFEFDAISVNGNSVYSSTNALISGLVPSTSYDVYARAMCGATDLSYSVGPYTFTTTHPRVTFSVNTANITVGTNGMYVGGGMIGGSDALALSDPDGDGVWTGDTLLPAYGAGSRNFAFFNSPNGSSDWNSKEDLTALPCADAGNYNDRNLPTFYSDTTLLYCFGACETDGTCPPLPTDYTVTFSVNTANITVGPNGMYVGGGMIGGSDALALSDPDGDGVWTGDTILPGTGSGFRNFVFFNSPNGSSDWGSKEDLTDLPCADAGNYNDRNLPMFYSDTTLLYCFGACETDGTCPPPPPSVTYQVDMNLSGYGPTAVPFLRGSWNWGGAGDMMTDVDGDGVWEFTKPLAGYAEYLFAVDSDGDGSFDVNESIDPSESCTNGNSQYTNRVITRVAQ
jgi:hypothetical protein